MGEGGFSAQGMYESIRVQYCEEFNVRRQGMCKAALDSLGNCPYQREHGDHLEQ